jgi:hypothetical protein
MFLRYWRHANVGFAFALLQATTLPFFVCFMMPDVLTGLAILSATALLLFWHRDGVAARAFWIAVMTAAGLSHSTNVPLLIAMAGGGLVLARRHRPWLAAATIVAAAFVGALGERAFAIGVTRLTGVAPTRPPYLTARLTADGPGTRYLRETCPASDFAMCRYVQRLPPLSANDFLWNESSEVGVFGSPDVSREERRLIAAEDARLAWAIFRYLPMSTLATLATGAYELLRAPELDVFNYYPHETGYFQTELPASTLAAVSQSRAFAASMPVSLPLALMRVLTPLALLLSVWAVLARSTPSDVRSMVALILVGVLVNAAVCGALSGPYPRYEDRVIWLLPFAALLTLGAPRNDEWRPNAGVGIRCPRDDAR